MVDENLVKNFEETVEQEPVVEDNEKVEEKTDVVVQEEPKTTLANVDVKNIKVKVNEDKSYEEQAEDIINMKSVVDVANDEDTGKVLMGQKKSQLIDKARKKTKEAQSDVIKAETEIQKAEREQYEGILETFGFYKHFPHWMMKAIVIILTPFLFIIGLVIGLPCGAVKILIDNVEGIVTKYNSASEKGGKTQIKVTIIIVLVLAVIAAICLTTLACLHII